MFKRLFFILLISGFSQYSFAEVVRLDVTIQEVGLSVNTQRVFIVATPFATTSECATKNHYSMELGKPESYMFYSAALTAMNEGKKMRVQFDTTECLQNSPLVNVFWNLNV